MPEISRFFEIILCVRRGPVFVPMRDPAFFRQARVEGGTIAWPNGANIAPETLYEMYEHAGPKGDA